MSQSKFYICEHCGNLVGMIESSGVAIHCCGQPMTNLIANTTEASIEKHIPSIEPSDDGIKVTVGSVIHPMTEAHYIKFIYVQTDKGGMRVSLSPNDQPVAQFNTVGQNVQAVYAYCNLHGLWKVE